MVNVPVVYSMNDDYNNAVSLKHRYLYYVLIKKNCTQRTWATDIPVKNRRSIIYL